MIIKKLTLKETTSDKEYTELCNTLEKQGVFRGCGNCDNKWIVVGFKDEVDYLAWAIATGFGELITVKEE